MREKSRRQKNQRLLSQKRSLFAVFVETNKTNQNATSLREYMRQLSLFEYST